MSQYYTGWIGLQLTGDRDVAQGYIREARKLVGAQRVINGVPGEGDDLFYKKVAVMADNTVITLVHNNGVDNVQIHAPQKGIAPGAPESVLHEFGGDLTHELLEGGGETPPSVRPFEPESEIKPVKEEKFKYDKRIFCLLGDDSVATSGPMHILYYLQTGARMVDDDSVFVMENIPVYRRSSDLLPNAPPFNLCTLDGQTMEQINSVALAGSLQYFDAAVSHKTVLFATLVGVFNTQYTLYSINMVDGVTATLGGFDPGQLPRYVPHAMLVMPGSDCVAFFNEAPIQLLDPSSLATTATCAADVPLSSDHTYSAPWQCHFVGNGAWAIWHFYTGEIEVQIEGGGGFTIHEPVHSTSVYAHISAVAVMRDQSTVWIYDGADDDLRVYRNGEWSGNMMPAEATPNFVMLYDPVSDSIALCPSSYYVGGTCGPLAWIFDAKACDDTPIETFSHDVSVGGAVPYHSSQFLDGAILTFTTNVAFDEVGAFLAADVSTSIYSKHVIGKLRQTKIEEYTRTSENGASTLISKEEYDNANGS